MQGVGSAQIFVPMERSFERRRHDHGTVNPGSVSELNNVLLWIKKLLEMRTDTRGENPRLKKGASK